MKLTLARFTALLLTPLALLSAADQPLPKVTDKLQPVTLNQAELSGEIGRRIQELIYKNYMAIDLPKTFADPIRLRQPRRYLGTGKVIAAGSRFAAYTGDAEVGRRTTQLIADVMRNRDPDGYLGTIPSKSADRFAWIAVPWAFHELEYIVLGLLENHRYCADATSLQYARELADYVIAMFSTSPHPEQIGTAGLAEALLLLYGSTGDARYRNFAANFRHGGPFGAPPIPVPMIEYASLRDWEKTNLGDRKVGHVYLNLARCYSQALLYRWEPQEKLLGVSRFILNELTRQDGCLNVHGTASEGERFSYAQNGGGKVGESCATAYLIRWLHNLLCLDGDLQYGDMMERAIYNALFAAQDPAGRQIRYFTPFEGPRSYYKSDGYCCPGNYRRIVAELPEMVYYRSSDGGVAVNLYTQSTKTIELNGGRKVALQQQTDYPTSGWVKITVSPSQPMEFPLRLRIPRWCLKAKLTVAGESPHEIAPGQPYFELRRTWKPGDVVTLEMPMPWRWVRGHGNQKERAALLRGPVVYCVGTAENAEVLKQFKDPREMSIDPATLGEPVADTSVRPNGLKVTARVRAPFDDHKGPATLDVVLTEFVDPSGVATFLRVPDTAKTVEDDLIKAK